MGCYCNPFILDVFSVQIYKMCLQSYLQHPSEANKKEGFRSRKIAHLSVKDGASGSPSWRERVNRTLYLMHVHVCSRMGLWH